MAVYYAVLALRWRAGRVSAAMLAVPRQRLGLFAAMGLLEALASLLGFAAAARLPGVLLPLLGQSILLWQVALGRLVLRKRLGVAQVAGTGLVLAGVCLAAWPSGGGSPLAGSSPLFACLFVISMLFPVRLCCLC